MDRVYDLSSEVPDGVYGGMWKKYDIKFMVGDKEVTAKCEVGLTTDYWDFCSVHVQNGQATVRKAI